MKIFSDDLSRFPEMELYRFTPNSDGLTTLVEAVSGVISASFSIQGLIEKRCVVTKKVIAMIKKLIAGLSEITISVTQKSFIVKSQFGSYTGQYMDDSMDFISSNTENLIAYNYNDSIVKLATNYCSNDKKIPYKHAVQIGEKGIVATDSFKFFIHGEPNSNCNYCVIDKDFFKFQKKFSCIKANKNIVQIYDDESAITWTSPLVDSIYPNIKPAFLQKPPAIDFTMDDLGLSLDMAISSLDTVSFKDNQFHGVISITKKGEALKIETANYSNTIQDEDLVSNFSFEIYAGYAALLSGARKLFYKDGGPLIYGELDESTTIIFILYAKK